MPRALKEKIPASLRWKVWGRDGFACHYCGRKGVPLHVDHKIPESKGGVTELDNLISACGRCNLRKGAKSYEAFMLELAGPRIASEVVRIPALMADGTRGSYCERLGKLSLCEALPRVEGRRWFRCNKSKHFVRHTRFLLSRHGRKLEQLLFLELPDDIRCYIDQYIFQATDPSTGQRRWVYRPFDSLTVEEWEWAVRDAMSRLDLAPGRFKEVCRRAHDRFGDAIQARFDFPLLSPPVD